MAYVVYVDHYNHKAIVHDEECTAHRRRGVRKVREDHWRTGFETAAEAMRFARSTGERRVDYCSWCLAEEKKKPARRGRSRTGFKVAIIGTGKPRSMQGRTGFAMAYSHADGYRATTGCELVACVDIAEENARAFADRYGLRRVYADYREMLATEKPDIVSICTWPHLHHPMVLDCARAGVRAIHCEKPMAPTFGEAKEMVRVCQETRTQLTFNHQRRFENRFVMARNLVREGVIGELRRMEGHWGNMMDVGTHWLDLFNFYNDDTPAEWVLAQVHRHNDASAFGVQVENQALCYIAYKNGVYGLLAMGEGHTIWAEHRLWGTEGVIEVDYPVVRVRGKGDGDWRVLEAANPEGPDASITKGIQDLVECLRTRREPVLSARNAFAATEIIFATYESCRRRGRVDLPLTIDDNPLHDLIKRGLLNR